MIRLAVLEDAARIYEIYCGYLNKQVQSECKYNLESFELYIDSEHVNIHVYENNSIIIGFILTFDMVDWGFIEVVSVDPAHRRKGIASQLIKHVIQHPKPLWFVIESCYNLSDNGVDTLLKNTGFQPSSQRTEWVYKVTS